MGDLKNIQLSLNVLFINTNLSSNINFIFVSGSICFLKRPTFYEFIF